MSSDLSWVHEYCLACDRQTDGATYCSESCRLSDFEHSSTTSTPASSPGASGPSTFNWTAPRSQSKFYLPPAYDFSNAQPYGSTPMPQSRLSRHSESSTSSTHILTPSSSHSSLCSLRSTSSSGSESTQLSVKAKQQLRDYASSFENARVQQRRRSH
ncbi:Uu.00g071060.m01.CDS01 [Anthostomella pinea]|uniref:Uu.00g071060.m01.CDS01 n=1 Tax=Anthostomella pinea TaxID=933095 RepID=A0AAI8YNU7_9PEZI|nr:Uu.00g071060.m01.CDS01 [Anthostomella pinea]